MLPFARTTMTESKTQHRMAALVTTALLAAALLSGCDRDASAVGSVDRSFTVSGPVRLELENGSGSARVTVGAPGEVRVHAEFRVHAWPWNDPDRTLHDLIANPPFSQDSNLIRIGQTGWDMSMVSADYVVTVPPDTQMRGRSGSGNLDVNGIAGPASLIVGSGNISATAIANETHALVGSGNATLTDTTGRVDVSAGSGNIEVHNAKEEVRVRTGSGNIRVERPGDNVVAETGSGEIEVRNAAADVRLHTSSGDIRVDGNPGPSSYWDVRASSGDVSLQVPPDASFRIYARSSSGDIDVRFPSLTESTQGKHDFQGRIGDGKARVEISTSSGNISLH
jgi:DUF4097 and DUF4098 domain-containing protein YvlB